MNDSNAQYGMAQRISVAQPINEQRLHGGDGSTTDHFLAKMPMSMARPWNPDSTSDLSRVAFTASTSHSHPTPP